MKKPKTPISRAGKHKSDSAVMEFYDWLRENFKFRLSTSVEQIFNRVPSGIISQYPELHHPISCSNVNDWVALARIWGFIHAGKPTGRMLDIGTGDGWPGIPIAIRGRTVVGIDIAPSRIKAAEAMADTLDARNIQFSPMPAEKMSFRDQTFESIVCGFSLEHVAQPDRVLEECWRVLVPGGRIIILSDSLKSHERANQTFETFHHVLDQENYQYNFRFRFFGSEHEEILSLVFPRLQKIIFADRQPLLKDSINQNQNNLESVKKALATIIPHEVESLSCRFSFFSSKTLAHKLKALGFANVRCVQDPAMMARHFLQGQNLQEPSHPFLHIPTFEGICSGLGAIAIGSAIDPNREDGLIIGEKPFF